MIFNLPAALPDLLPSQLPPETDKVVFVENVFHARQKNSGSPSRISTSRLVLLAGERHFYSSLQTKQSVKNDSRVISTGTSPLPSPCPWTPASTYIPSPKVSRVPGPSWGKRFQITFESHFACIWRSILTNSISGGFSLPLPRPLPPPLTVLSERGFALLAKIKVNSVFAWPIFWISDKDWYLLWSRDSSFSATWVWNSHNFPFSDLLCRNGLQVPGEIESKNPFYFEERKICIFVLIWKLYLCPKWNIK